MANPFLEEMQNLKYTGQKIRLNLGTLAVIFLCTFSIVVATFTQIKIDFTHLLGFSTGCSFVNYSYIPQIPVIFFIAALLGKRFSLLAVLLYIIIGLFFPVYALGGGIKYVLQYNFGYILAYLPAVFLTAYFLEKGYNFKNLLKSVLVCVLTIHVMGMLYLMLVAVIKQDSFYYIFDFLFLQSGIKFIYDFVFCVLIALVMRPLKQLFWFIMI